MGEFFAALAGAIAAPDSRDAARSFLQEEQYWLLPQCAKRAQNVGELTEGLNTLVRVVHAGNDVAAAESLMFAVMGFAFSADEPDAEPLLTILDSLFTGGGPLGQRLAASGPIDCGLDRWRLRRLADRWWTLEIDPEAGRTL